MLYFLVLSIELLRSNHLKQANGNAVVLSIDFGLLNTGPNSTIFNCDSKETIINITNIPNGTNLAFVGNYIQLTQTINNNKIREAKIYAQRGSTINFYTDSNATISFSNLFSLLSLYQNKYQIFPAQNCTIKVLQNSALITSFDITVKQFHDTNYYFESNNIPFSIDQQNHSKIYITVGNSKILKIKELFLKSNISIYSTVANMCLQTELLHCAQDITLVTNGITIDVNMLRLQNSNLNAINTDFVISVLSLDNSIMNAGNIQSKSPAKIFIRDSNSILNVKSIKDMQFTYFVNTKIVGPLAPKVLFTSEQEFKFDKRNLSLIDRDAKFKLDYDASINGNQGMAKNILILYDTEQITLNITDTEGVNSLRDLSSYNQLNHSTINISIAFLSQTPIFIDKIPEMYDKIIIHSAFHTNTIAINITNPSALINLDNFTIINSSITCYSIGITNKARAAPSTIIHAQKIVIDYSATANLTNLFVDELEYHSSSAYVHLYDEYLVASDAYINHKNVKTIIFEAQRRESFTFYTNDVRKLQFNDLNVLEYQYNFTKQNVSFFALQEGRKNTIIANELPRILELHNSFNLETKTNYLNSSLMEIENDITIDVDHNMTIDARTISLGYVASLNSNNILFKTRTLESFTSSLKASKHFSAAKLAIYHSSFGNISRIDDLCKISLLYGAQKLGSLHVNELYQSDQCETLKVKLSNIYDPQSHDFYFNDIDDMSIEFLCFNKTNIHNISVEFKSDTWAFNSTTRLFDMELTQRSNLTCMSIVKRKETNNSSGKINFFLKYWIPLVCIAVLLLVVLSITLLLLKKRKKKAIDQFIFSDTLTDSLIQ